MSTFYNININEACFRIIFVQENILMLCDVYLPMLSPLYFKQLFVSVVNLSLDKLVQRNKMFLIALMFRALLGFY